MQQDVRLASGFSTRRGAITLIEVGQRVVGGVEDVLRVCRTLIAVPRIGSPGGRGVAEGDGWSRIVEGRKPVVPALLRRARHVEGVVDGPDAERVSAAGGEGPQ